jgi:tetratricopeptide (TPR) repeat protein
MSRLVLSFVALLAVLWVLLGLGILPPAVAAVVEPIVGLACSLFVPLLFLTAYLAPGLFREVIDDVQHYWRRIRTRRRDILDLERKIAHLDRPYHMHQLGLVFATQGRTTKAQPWFEKALAKDPKLIDAKYQLALCHFHQHHFAKATELLEQIHQEKPDHDYGMAYLRLAESQQQLGNLPRAAEIYQTLLRFYPSQPEGSYHYALLLAQQNSFDSARKLMRDIITTLRLSPGFYRRRNRHWAMRAQWWLWRHRNQHDPSET